jgi:uncharacterized protein HemY
MTSIDPVQDTSPAERQSPEAEREFSRGMAKLAGGDVLGAMVHFEKATAIGAEPACLSFLGYCIAKERGQAKKGLAFCQKALAAEPDNPVHSLNMARIHLVTGDKPAALAALRSGAAHGQHQEIADLLDSVGTRKPPIFPFLHRNHPLNKYLGKFLARLGLR